MDEAYLRLKQIDTVSECCMASGRYDPALGTAADASAALTEVLSGESGGLSGSLEPPPEPVLTYIPVDQPYAALHNRRPDALSEQR